MPLHTLTDLVDTRKNMLDGMANASDLLDACVAVAQSQACDKVFLRTMFDEARQVALGADARRMPLAGLAVSVKDLFDIAGQVTTAGSLTRDARSSISAR